MSENPRITIELDLKTGNVTTEGPASHPVLMLRMLSGALTQVAEEVVRPLSENEHPSPIIQVNPHGIVPA